MFSNFCNFFKIQPPKRTIEKERSLNGFADLMGSFGGHTFGRGLYRLHTYNTIDRWNSNILQAFPGFKDRITCFGYDWLGRQFALDNHVMLHGQPQILMFEPGTAEALEIPCNFIQFHEEEIPKHHDSCLASAFFQEWLHRDSNTLKNTECVGYKVMLFLGGEDTIENLERSDMDVYWSICSQVMKRTRNHT